MRYNEQIALLRKRHNWSQAELAERMGVEQPTVQRWEAGTREPSYDKLAALSKVLNVPVSAILGELPISFVGPTLRVRGEVAAGVWRAAIEWPEGDWQTFTGREDITADIEHRFGLKIVGDSMDEIYPDGSIVECVSLFGRAEALPGKRVVVVRENDLGCFEATVKELVDRDGELWLVPRSRNPAHVAYRLNDEIPGIVETRITAVVVASYRPE